MWGSMPEPLRTMGRLRAPLPGRVLGSRPRGPPQQSHLKLPGGGEAGSLALRQAPQRSTCFSLLARLSRRCPRGPALPSALTRGAGLEGWAPGFLLDPQRPAPGTEGGPDRRVGGGQGRRGRRGGTLGPSAPESVVAEGVGGREAALQGGVTGARRGAPTRPGHVAVPRGPLCRAAL